MLLRTTLALLIALFLATPLAASPATLTYVESSTGLDVPYLETGNTELEFGDVNADGHIDIVSIGDHGSPYINTPEHGIMVWFGDGTGQWSVSQYGDFGYGGVALGDANGDGHLDVGYGMHHDYSPTDLGDQILEVALGDGSGLAWIPWDDGLATNGETWGMFNSDFADVDNDGDLDLGSLSFGCCAGVHVYLNQGDGTWQQSFGFLGNNASFAFTFGDVNGDGYADFAVAHEAGTVYLGDGAGGFALADGNLPPPGWLGRRGPDLGDVNGDAQEDLSFCNGNGGVEVWAWEGDGVWSDASGALPTTGGCEATQLADMDADGYTDVVTFGEGLVQVWTGDGGGSWTLSASFTLPPYGYSAAFRAGVDADHNGYPDIALVSEEGGWPNEQNHLRFFKEASEPAELSVTPVYPRGGETLYAGSVRFLDWLSAVPDGEDSNVEIQLSLSGPGGPWLPIAAGLPDNGRFQWQLPDDLASTDQAYLRMTVSTPSGEATALTPAPFTIIAGSGMPTVHVRGIQLRGAEAPGGYGVRVVVRVADEDLRPVADAEVSATLTLPDGRELPRVAVTRASGVALFRMKSLNGGTWLACVEDISLPGYLYDPSQNVETCDAIDYP